MNNGRIRRKREPDDPLPVEPLTARNRLREAKKRATLQICGHGRLAYALGFQPRQAGSIPVARYDLQAALRVSGNPAEPGRMAANEKATVGVRQGQSEPSSPPEIYPCSSTEESPSSKRLVAGSSPAKGANMREMSEDEKKSFEWLDSLMDIGCSGCGRIKYNLSLTISRSFKTIKCSNCGQILWPIERS